MDSERSGACVWSQRPASWISAAPGCLLRVHLRCVGEVGIIGSHPPNGSTEFPGDLLLERAVKKEIGLQMNVHLFRHLAAKLLLAAHPGDYETVRLLLGHKSLVTTVRNYCGLEQSDAMRRYDAVLDRYRADDDDDDVA